jgi:murein DD-endopeptidase MepM/ murein hydrolase activator NlpD
MINRLLSSMVLALLYCLTSVAQSHSGFPVDITSGPPPQPVLVNGFRHLVYELRVTNVAPIPIDLLGLEIFDDESKALANYRNQELEKLLVPLENVLISVEPGNVTGKRQAIAAGHSVILFLDLRLDGKLPLPSTLRHRFSFDISRNTDLNRTVNGPAVAVVQEAAPVLGSPLRGSAWAAFNAFSAYDHRRAFQTVDGRLCIAQRFAIDWMRLGPDGRLFHDDSKANGNFYGYGQEVLAVADSRVSDLRNNIPDNTGSNERTSRHISVDDAVGNYLMLDLGHGNFAVYAHLQPGSLRVKIGENVKAGQVLALLGNSGNSDAPHLHFQLVNANSPMAAEGIPYEIASFTRLGVLEDAKALDAGGVWRPKAQTTPVFIQNEFPVTDEVLDFP